MRSAVQYYGAIDDRLSSALRTMRHLLEIMPDNGTELWSCHAATRAFKEFLDLPYDIKDGFFASKGVCHSWLETEIGGHLLAIDILPMGAHGGPIVADIGRFAPWGRLYIEDAYYHADSSEKFAAEAALFLAALRSVDP